MSPFVRQLSMSGNEIGAVAGRNEGQILNCSFSGTVSGGDYVGGIAGTNAVTGIVHQLREGEIDPDAALNDNDQQHRQARRLERKQQHHNNEKRGQNGDHQIVGDKGSGQISAAGGIAHHIVIILIIPANDGAHLIQERIGLIPFLGQSQIDHHPAVGVVLKLGLGQLQLRKQVVDLCLIPAGSAIRSRKLINGALADLLTEKPLDKITVTDIVNRADINRGTFYAHYRDVPDVVDHLIQQTFSAIRDAVIAQAAGDTTVEHALLSTIRSILEGDLSFYRKILCSSASAIMREQLAAVVTEFMLEQKDRFYPGSQEEYQIAIRFCAGGLSNLYRDWFSGKLPYTLEELTRIGEALIRRFIG